MSDETYSEVVLPSTPRRKTENARIIRSCRKKYSELVAESAVWLRGIADMRLTSRRGSRISFAWLKIGSRS